MASSSNNKEFWDVIMATSPFLQQSDEINSCCLCTNTTDIVKTVMATSGTEFGINRGKNVLCETCEQYAAFPFTFMRGSGFNPENEIIVKEIAFNDAEAAFFEKFFFRYGVEKSEVKRFFQRVSVRSYVSEVNGNFSALKRFGGNPEKFASMFYKKGKKRPRTRRLDDFLKCLKIAVEKYEKASRRELNGDSDSQSISTVTLEG